MARVPGRAVLMAIAFAILVGASCSFLGSPWSTAWNWASAWPMVAGGAVGLLFGLLAARMRRVGWILWLLTLPGVAVWTWFEVDRCATQPVYDDCGIAWIVPLGWLAPWAIGIGLLALATLVSRRAESSSLSKGTP